MTFWWLDESKLEVCILPCCLALLKELFGPFFFLFSFCHHRFFTWKRFTFKLIWNKIPPTQYVIVDVKDIFCVID